MDFYQFLTRRATVLKAGWAKNLQVFPSTINMDDTVLHTYQLFHGCEHIINSCVFKPVVRHVHNTAVRKIKNYHTHSFIQDFEFGGEEQGDSSVRKCTHPCLRVCAY